MGQIITFYSYKGGTGRSMALANVAWILAANGKRVLAVDWDLEAPSLHRYFRPFLMDRDLISTGGIFDLVFDYALAAMTPVEEGATPDWYKSYADILRYAVSLEWEFPDGGHLDFVPAGRQDSAYPSKLIAFNWQSFYERLGGGHLLEEVREKMRSEYDYVLIDSRTGVGDTSSLCTVAMPDSLVVCFTLNQQSVKGAQTVATYVQEQRIRQETNIRILPVPMRVELSEKMMLDKAMEAAKDRFSPFLYWLPAERQNKYWSQVRFLYTPYYAYNEVIAAFSEQPDVVNSVLSSAENLTAFLTAGEVRRAAPIPERVRRRVLNEYNLDGEAV
jgi:MinD-like ATPase involved in chromosome partitioning or flagellar assembly